MAVLRAHVDRVEVVGLDEAYLDLSGLERPKAAARRVKAAVREDTGLGCSIGIGPSKLVAKVASDAEKPDGFVVLTPRAGVRALRRAPPGAHSRDRAEDRRAARASRGSTTLGGARRRARRRRSSSGSAPRLGPHLGRLARFEDEREVTTVRVAKSESRETTFDHDLRGLDALEPVLERLAERAVRDARQRRAPRAARSASRCASTTSRPTRARARSSGPSTSRRPCSRSRSTLLRELDPREPVRLLGVRVAGLDEEGRRARRARRPSGPARAVARRGS